MHFKRLCSWPQEGLTHVSLPARGSVIDYGLICNFSFAFNFRVRKQIICKYMPVEMSTKTKVTDQSQSKVFGAKVTKSRGILRKLSSRK